MIEITEITKRNITEYLYFHLIFSLNGSTQFFCIRYGVGSAFLDKNEVNCDKLA